jgi:serine/threonine-protein kinase HipA
MVNPVTLAEVALWGQRVGAVLWEDNRQLAAFEFDPDFLRSGLDLAPLTMPLADTRAGEVFQFPALSRDTFHGLPGLLADALPDKFGNAIIDSWLARNGRSPASFSPVERLCYIGRRGMGALEFSPATHPKLDHSVSVDIAELTELAQQIIQERTHLNTQLSHDETENGEAIMDILRVGTSAGGARAKAIIAMNEQGHVRSGQVQAPEGYDYWLLKFDSTHDLELGKTAGYGRIEYAYHLMAKAAGITMSECRLLEENGRAHFMTRRFDRANGLKLHMTSLCGIAHYDFNMPGAYGYEQVFDVMRRLRLSRAEAAQQYRRMLFNVLARNQDDHTKNIAFLMDKAGNWSLSPAFDVNYAHNPQGQWTNQHQMTLNGKRDHFTRDELLAIGQNINLPSPKTLLQEVAQAVREWPRFAREARVPEQTIQTIAQQHRLALDN